MRITLQEMRLAIHQTQDCEAKRHIEITNVETSRNGVVKSIDVHLFEIEGHPSATKCYAWVVKKSDTKIAIPTVLHNESNASAEQAVNNYRDVE